LSGRVHFGMLARMMWRGLILLVLLAIAGAAIFLLSPQKQSWLDRARINADRAAHRADWRAGRALPGTPELANLDARLKAHGVKLGDPVFLRIYKLNFLVELWMGKPDGTYVHVANYPICYWSGRLGPKLHEGDGQAPEGYYTIDQSQLNPKSRWFRAFNLGFPNAFDQAHGRTGSFLMMHGGCASIGCYAMTNAVIGELWTIVTAALDAGQKRVAVLALPFPLTQANLVKRRADRWDGFWTDLKAGSDLFDRSHVPPVASVCEGRYVFRPGSPGQPVPAVALGCPGPLASNP
jgi:murein L,D-transpeptidase YafK